MSVLSQFRPEEGGGGEGGGILASSIIASAPDSTVSVNTELARDFNILKAASNITVDMDTTPTGYSQGTLTVTPFGGDIETNFTNKFVNKDEVDIPLEVFPENLIPQRGNERDIGSLIGALWACGWSPTGDKFYVSDTNKIDQYNVSFTDLFDLNAIGTTPDATHNFDGLYTVNGGWCFNGDGTKLFYADDVGSETIRINEVVLSIPYDLASVVTDTLATTLTVPSDANFRDVHSLCFNEDGTKLVTCVFEESLQLCVSLMTTPYDLSTITSTVSSRWGSEALTRSIAPLHGDWFIATSAERIPNSVFKLSSAGLPIKTFHLNNVADKNDQLRQFLFYKNGQVMIRGLRGNLNYCKMFSAPLQKRYWYTQLGDSVYIDNVEAIR